MAETDRDTSYCSNKSGGLSGGTVIKRRRPRDRYLLQPPLDYNFSLGQSSFTAPASVVEALRLHAHEKDYLPVKGLSALKESVSEFHRQKDLVDANSDCVLVGPGSKELMFLLQLVFYGEIICSLCERLLQDAGGVMLPGRAFERLAEELTARISISIFRSKIVAAAETIALHHELPDEFIQTHCQDALEGMERLVGS